MKSFLAGVFVAFLGVIGGVYVYFAGGYAPVATSAPPMPFEKLLARHALHARIEKEMPRAVPIAADEPAFVAGARIYLQHCAVCHGLPGKPESAIARGEFPHPPQLFRGKGVTDDEPGETYWKTANGIRMTGMPGFSKSLSDTEMWQVSLMLAHADKLPAAATAALAGTAAVAGEAAAPPPAEPSPE